MLLKTFFVEEETSVQGRDIEISCRKKDLRREERERSGRVKKTFQTRRRKNKSEGEE